MFIPTSSHEMTISREKCVFAICFVSTFAYRQILRVDLVVREQWADSVCHFILNAVIWCADDFFLPLPVVVVLYSAEKATR